MTLDSTGWLCGVRRVASPNWDERPPGCAIDTLVIHNISLPPGQFGGPHVDELFCNRIDSQAHPAFAKLSGLRVSAHALINRGGQITQYVSFSKRAWHAGESCWQGRKNFNDFSIGIELEGTDRASYTDAQYTALTQLSLVLMTRWPDICPQRIVGHADIAPERKTDPGAAFQWGRFRRELEKNRDL